MSGHKDGELTRLSRNDIIYSDREYGPKYEEENYNPHLAFQSGVVNRILKIGYTGYTDNMLLVADFVCDKFKEHNIQIKKKDQDRTRVNIENWLLKNPPNDSEQSRPNVYKLCFALEMDAEQTSVFFLKNYLCRPFNFKNAEEAAYYFCLNTRRSYHDAVELIGKIRNMPTAARTDDIETRMLEIPLTDIQTEEDFLLYMENHRYDKSKYRNTVFKELDSLISDCKKLADVTSSEALLEQILGYSERNVFYLDKELGKYKSFGISKSELPDAVTRNFPRPVNFSQIKNRIAKDDTCRKMLIILYFYKYYKKVMRSTAGYYTDPDILLEEFEMCLDQLLEKCGYVQVYWRNPFDRFILFCAKQKDPVTKLQELLRLYYTDIVDAVE